MDTVRLILYWGFYVNSIIGMKEGTGVLLVGKDSLKTYIPGEQYAKFKIDYIKQQGDKHFQIIATREKCVLTITTNNEIIEQVLVIQDLNYVNRTTFTIKTLGTKTRRRKK